MKHLSPVPIVLAMALAGCEPEPATVSVSVPWILEAPAGTTSMAGYGVLANGTGEPMVVTGVTSPAFERVRMHETRVEGGRARMAPVDALTLPPGGRMVMRPGGLHLMLVGPRASLEAGDSAEVRFHFDGGDTLAARFPVRREPPAEE